MAALWSKSSRRLNRGVKISSIYSKRKFETTSGTSLREGYTEEPAYPPIKPGLPPGNWGNMEPSVCWKWHDYKEEYIRTPALRQRFKYIESKYFSKEYGFKLWRYDLLDRNPGNLAYQQEITKTILVPEMPPLLSTGLVAGTYEQNLDEVIRFLEPRVKEILVQNHLKNPQFQDFKSTSILLKNLLFTIITYMGSKCPHLLDIQLSENTPIAAHWDRCGVKRWKLKPVTDRRHVALPVYMRAPIIRYSPPEACQNNSKFYCTGQINFMLRSENPLPEFDVRHNEGISSEGSLYGEKLRWPTAYGARWEWSKVSVDPGFHIGDPSQFGYLFIQNSRKNCSQKMSEKFGEKFAEESRTGFGMSTGFVWNVAQAYYQGFSTYNDITYPFTSLGIVTDGKKFQFFAYQLNTLHLWKEDSANPMYNVCWHSLEEELYDTIEDNEVHGFNMDVFTQLIRYLLLQPADRGYDLKPHLPLDSPDRRRGSPWINIQTPESEIEEEVSYDVS